jgi:alpha/beta superfamily hydrolase
MPCGVKEKGKYYSNLINHPMIQEESFFLKKSKKDFISATLHKASSKKLVILSHGFTGSKIECSRIFVYTARFFAKNKINALRFDFVGSGDSSGDFQDMCVNSEMEDLHLVIRWAQKKGYRDIGLLGLSLGSAVTICTAAQLKPKTIKAIVTWSSLPSYVGWRLKPDPAVAKTFPMAPGPIFYKKRPKVDIPDAYCSLTIPKLQIQGDKDLPGFVEKFSKYFKKAPGPKKHVIIKDGDHVFNDTRHREIAIRQSFAWFKKYL